MSNEEALKKLARLSPRERQVLIMVCEGMEYEEIGKRLFIAEPTVKNEMVHVYIKLEITHLNKAGRRMEIYDVYRPLLKSAGSSAQSMSPEITSSSEKEPRASGTNQPASVQIEKPVSPGGNESQATDQNKQVISGGDETTHSDTESSVPMEIIKLVEEDEPGGAPPKEPVIVIPQPRKPEPPPPPSRWKVWGILAGVFIIACLCIGAVLIGSRFIPGLFPSQPGVATQVNQPANTPITYPTSAQQLPTDTSITQENTAVPTNPPAPTTTPLPTTIVPSISLPFSDNFDNGANSAWNILSGTWITANGRYTISNADVTWAFSVLDDPSWTNYRVKVNIIRSHPGAFSEGEEAIIVRYLSSETKYLVFYLNTLEQAGWAIYDGKNFNFVAEHKSNAVPNQYDLEIDAVGNTFIAKINGMTVQQISISGYDHGGVGLGTICQSTPCSSFKDFQVSSTP